MRSSLTSLRRRPPGRARGFTYVGVLILVVMMGLMLAAAGEVWRTRVQRENELQLLFVGGQYRAAISSYLRASPGAPEYPKTLEDLLEDRRLPQVRRHLRRLFPDPMTGSADWELIRAGDRITGVASRSTGEPFKRTGYAKEDEGFAEATTYRDWRFVASGAGPKTTVPVTANATGAPVAVPAPVADSEPPAPVITVPLPPRPESDSRCDDQRQTDFPRCADLRETATSAEVAACAASVTARYLACRRRQDIPPLALPTKR